MKMMKTELEFVAFEAQDVIATSGPLAFAKGYTMVDAFASFSDYGELTVGDYDDDMDLARFLGEFDDYYYEITGASGNDTDGYQLYVDFDSKYENKKQVPLTKEGIFGDYDELFAWIRRYCAQ